MLTVIIPTLQKNKDILNSLISSLVKDEIVNEILIIDNTSKGFLTSENKVRVITPEKNIFVNPSWNLGVKQAKNNYFALFNDDLLVCDNFCSKILQLIKNSKNFGALGMASESVINLSYPCDKPAFTKLKLTEDNNERPNNWGCIIFGKKDNWIDIPENIKVVCGDDFIRYMERKQNRQIYKLSNAIVHHIGGLSSSNPKLINILKNDIIIYAKIDEDFKSTPFYTWATDTKIKKVINRIKHFIYQKKITKSGKMITKICKIPVYRRKI